MSTKGVLALLLLCGLMLAITACGENTAATPTDQQASIKTVTMDASWPRAYHDLQALKQDADIAVSGTFTGIAGTAQLTKGPIVTDYTFSVKQVIWQSKNSTVAPTLTIRQSGGIDNNVRYQVADDPLFQTGERSILFLHEYSAGHYYVIGGPTGRFTVQQDGTITSASQEGVLLQNISEKDFATRIQNS